MRRHGGWLAWGGSGVVAGVIALGCGGPAEPAQGPEAANNISDGASAELGVEGTVGALDAHAVREKAERVRHRAEACVAEARAKLPYLSGDVDVFVRVDAGGRAQQVYFERSTIGHRATEACILEAFRSAQWPRPVGGKTGEISQSFGFDSGYDEPPSDWSDADLEEAMAAEAGAGPPPFRELLSKLDSCKREAGGGSLLVTMYLDEDGLVQGVGMSAADPRGMEAAACVATVVQTTSFPASGALVKASLRVP